MKFEPTNPVSAEDIHSHIRSATTRGLPQVLFQPPRKDPMIVVGGGPSLKTPAILRDLRRRKGNILALNGAHDFLIGKGIHPWGMMMYDPRADNVGFLRKPRKGVTYYLASQCDPGAFDALAGHEVILWHANAGTNEADLLRELYGPADPWCLIAGGTTVGTRALYVGQALGFRKFHLYGMDSCLGADDEVHAYDQRLRGFVAEDRVKVEAAGRIFIATRWMHQQAKDFAELLRSHGETLDIRVHGGGLLAAVLEQHKAQRSG